jgi:hypothetical protein
MLNSQDQRVKDLELLTKPHYLEVEIKPYSSKKKNKIKIKEKKLIFD